MPIRTSTSKGGAALEGFGLTLFGLTVRRAPKRLVQAMSDNGPSGRTLLRRLEEVVLGAGGPPAARATGRRITAEGEPKRRESRTSAHRREGAGGRIRVAPRVAGADGHDQREVGPPRVLGPRRAHGGRTLESVLASRVGGCLGAVGRRR